MKKLLVTMLTILALFGCAQNLVTEEQPKPVEKPSEYSLGQKVSFESGLTVTVVSTRSDMGGEYFKPDEGNEFLVIKVRLENNTKETYNMSSFLSFELKSKEGVVMSRSFYPDMIGSLDSSILSGDLLVGEIAFEVPLSITEGLFLYFKVDLLSDPIKIKIK
ncbi:MAG: DUF4352 domain-containing protein [Erysipelothrix sp.]|nr:DUF4352 domain-containing protein [Erysipelothrix sp.]